MAKIKTQERVWQARLARVKKEMSAPRVAKRARFETAKLAQLALQKVAQKT